MHPRHVHELLDAGKAHEIFFNIHLRGGALDAEVAGQAERAHAVNQAEVDHLGITTLLAGDFRCRCAENFSSSGTMNIHAFGKCAQHVLIARDVGHDAQFDLRIVGGNNHAIFGRYKRFADTPAFGGANRDILQVRIVRRQPSGNGNRLCIIGMHATGFRIDHLRQFVGVGRFQLGQAAVIEQHLWQRIIFRQFLQHFFIGRRRSGWRFLDHRQLEFIEQDFAQLFG